MDSRNRTDNLASSTSTAASSNVIYYLHVPWDQVDLGRFLFFTTASSLCEALVYYPLDLLRTRLQVQREPFSVRVFIRTVKQLGPSGLYRGFWSQLGGLPSYIIYMWSYSYFRDRLQGVVDASSGNRNISHKTSPWVAFAAGGLADVFSNVFLCPAEVVIQRLQISELAQRRYKGGIDAMKHIFKEEGIRGFYRGLGATLLTYAPGSAIWWMTYEHYKEIFSRWIDSRHATGEATLTVSQHYTAQFLAGLVAGVVTVVATNPMDVIKTRLQTQHTQFAQAKLDQSSAPTSKLTTPSPSATTTSTNSTAAMTAKMMASSSAASSSAASAVLYKNSWDAFQQMMRKEGVGAFRKGLVPRLLTSGLMSPIFSIFYELIMELSRKPGVKED